jgi:putative heme-binding domain-containing protein
MTHAEDAGDPNLPTLLWLGVEPLVQGNPTLALEHASRSGIPVIAQYVARRSVDADALEPLVAAIGRSPRTVVSLLEGMRDGLEGRFDLTAPSNWTSALGRLQRADPPVARLAGEVARRFGDTEAARRNLAAVRSRTDPVDQRRRALQVLAAQRRSQLVQELPAVLDDAALRLEGIRAIASFDDDGLGKLLVARYGGFNATEKLEALQTLSSRARYGRLLTEALARGIVPRRDVPQHIARQLRRVVGVRFAEVWGPVEQDAAEEKTFSKYRSLLNDQAIGGANVQKGKAVFQQKCGPCHKMYAEGGALAPDLTGSNRANLDYLLFNVLNPNGDVPDAYRMVLVTTRDGRTFSGNVVAETDRQLTLRVVGQDVAVVNKSDIQSRESTALSMMPPGLFDGLTDREVIDLVGYLRTVDPVKAP